MNTVLFDLDGTLLPMNEEQFTKVYFKELCTTLAPTGFDQDTLVKVIWTGTKAMVKNDGMATNDQRFWDTFEQLLDCDVVKMRNMCDAFYGDQFDRVKVVTSPAPHSAEVVRTLKQRGFKVVLATNPIFPMVAVETRLKWVGLTTADFDLITTYETSHFCKPNLEYYREILKNIDREPQDCLMVGNNVGEDMCFAQLGGQVFLLNDFVENSKNLPIGDYPQGNFEALKQYLDTLSI